MTLDCPLYLHFLDRELGRSVQFSIDSESAERIVKCLLLGTASRLYCGLSLAWESSAIQGAFALFLPVLLNARAVDLVSHHSTLDEFIASRGTLYRHDERRYPMYFEVNGRSGHPFQPTLFKASSTTLALAKDLNRWAEVGAGRITDSSDEQLPDSTLKGIREALLRREEQAITFPLFESAIASESSVTQGMVRRRISIAYTNHYATFGGGDIPTGIRGLEYFDQTAQAFPLYDIEILSRLLRVSGLGAYLDQPWAEHRDWWQQFLAVRGEGAAHIGLRSDIQLIIQSLHNGRARASPDHMYSHYAVRQAMLLTLSHAGAAIANPRHTLVTGDIEAALARLRNLVAHLKQDKTFAENWDIIVSDQTIRCDLLLVVATEVERDAVLDILNLAGGDQPPLHFGTRRTYFDLGLVGGARVLLVQSEMGSGSRGASLQTVGDALDDLKPPAVIMLGIAFGVRPKKQKIGYLTVSRQLQCYDLQRVGTESDGSPRIIPRGERVTASTMLLGRLRAATAGWGDDAPVNFGLMLSGEKLVDNVDFRDQLLAMAPEAIAGEMEGAGVYAAAAERHVDWILVKGICDWADGKKRFKKKERQATAARNAARFVLRAIQQGGFSAAHPAGNTR